MDATTTPRPDHLFKPGNPHAANRKGQKGARQRLAEMVFTDVLAHWEEQGQGFLRRLAFHDYAAFASFVAKILPQRIEIETATPFDHVDEALLAISLRISKSIAFLPPEDRELLDMLLDKGELLASQKNFSEHEAEEGVGGQNKNIFVGGEGSPHPQNASPADRNSGGPPLLTATLQSGGTFSAAGISVAAASVEEANVIDGENPEEE